MNMQSEKALAGLAAAAFVCVALNGCDADQPSNERQASFEEALEDSTLSDEAKDALADAVQARAETEATDQLTAAPDTMAVGTCGSFYDLSPYFPGGQMLYQPHFSYSTLPAKGSCAAALSACYGTAATGGEWIMPFEGYFDHYCYNNTPDPYPQLAPWRWDWSIGGTGIPW